MDNWTPVIDSETVLASKYNDDVMGLNRVIESLRHQLKHSAKEIKEQHKAKNEWKRRATHLRDWVKHQHGIGTAVGLGEVNEICLEAEYTDQFPEMRAWLDENT